MSKKEAGWQLHAEQLMLTGMEIALTQAIEGQHNGKKVLPSAGAIKGIDCVVMDTFQPVKENSQPESHVVVNVSFGTKVSLEAGKSAQEARHEKILVLEDAFEAALPALEQAFNKAGLTKKEVSARTSEGLGYGFWNALFLKRGNNSDAALDIGSKQYSLTHYTGNMGDNGEMNLIGCSILLPNNPEQLEKAREVVQARLQQVSLEAPPAQSATVAALVQPEEVAVRKPS